MNTIEIPLFPLQAVLFPGGPMPLKIFEPRYLGMISRCLKDNAGFGVVLIRDGAEVGPATTYDVGTLVRIDDWYQGEDSMLRISVVGEERFLLESASTRDDGLNVGTVTLMQAEPKTLLPDDCSILTDVLDDLFNQVGGCYENIERRFSDASWVGFRLAEIIPISLEQRQHCLEITDSLIRLKVLMSLIKTIGTAS
ncbi:MAG: LON peptidase substrate-binding domain-containing protein [Gammaproteobacteria bacterium]